VRLTLPKVSAGAVEKAAGLIQLSMRWPTSPGVVGDSPVAFGRWLALKRYWLLLLPFSAKTHEGDQVHDVFPAIPILFEPNSMF